MSEYQYYEFAAIDRRLTPAEMAQLREVSTRGQITSASFTNHYEWSGLKANPADWMARYFDAFVYTANWCSCRLALRLPLATLQRTVLEPFTDGDAFNVQATETHWILDWSLDESEDCDRFSMDGGGGWMGRLAPLREELLRGDLRPLYLGWLAGAHGLEDKALEPEVPLGLAELSAAQRALVEFIEVDADLLTAAAAGSASATVADSARASSLDEWVGEWPRRDMSAMLKLLAQGQGREAERLVRSHHEAWLNQHGFLSGITAPRRRVEQLRQAAQSASAVRLAREGRERAAEAAARQAERETVLRQLMADVDARWAHIDALASKGTASAYEQAIRAMAELAEGYALVTSPQEFDLALMRLLARHGRRYGLVERLDAAGLRSR